MSNHHRGGRHSQAPSESMRRNSLAERAAQNRGQGNLSAKYSERARAKRYPSVSARGAVSPKAARPPQQKNSAYPNRRPPSRKRRRRYRLEPRAKVILFILALLLLLGLGSCTKALFSSDSNENTAPVVADAEKKGKTTDETFARRILSDAAILVNAKTGEVLFEKNADEQEKPASLVKLMTVYTALKIKGQDLSEVVAVPEAAFQNLGEAAVSGLSPNELVSIKDLLYATLLPSGGDAAQALALVCSRDNMDRFVEKMNENAQDIGMRNTRYTNVIGLDSDNQLSTARDLSKLMLKAVNDDRFYSVLTSDHYNTRTSSEHAQGVLLLHTLKTHMNEFPQEMKPKGYEIVGGKTGYTTEAGICLASVAKNEAGDMYIAVTLHAGGDLNNYYPAVKDAIQLYNYAFNKDGR